MPINSTQAVADNNKNGVIPRIDFGEKPIWRVYQGDKLVWGLFNANYKSISSVSSSAIQSGGSATIVDDTTNPSLFTWGLGVPSLKNPASVSNATFIKWCSDASVNTEVKSIGIDVQTDTTLYAKWYIRGTQYRVTYEWTEQTGGGGGGWTKPTEGALISDYYSSPPYSYSDGCTSWVACRINSIAGTSHSSSYGYWAGGYYYIGEGDGSPGDVVIYIRNSDGWGLHEAFIESDGSESYTNSNTSKYDSTHVHYGAGSFDVAYTRTLWKTPASGKGGGGGSTVTHSATTDWQWNTSIPQGNATKTETRDVYRYFDYSTKQWSALTTTKPS